MTIIIDASAMVAALVDAGPDGEWAEKFLAVDDLAAPHLMPAEVTNILRRTSISGLITSDVASLAIADLAGLRIEFFAFDPFAQRIWELRENVTAYDAWYVALAETLAAPLATLDDRLSRAAGPRCKFLTPRG